MISIIFGCSQKQEATENWSILHGICRQTSLQRLFSTQFIFCSVSCFDCCFSLEADSTDTGYCDHITLVLLGVLLTSHYDSRYICSVVLLNLFILLFLTDKDVFQTYAVGYPLEAFLHKQLQFHPTHAQGHCRQSPENTYKTFCTACPFVLKILLSQETRLPPKAKGRNEFLSVACTQPRNLCLETSGQV